ncbi:MAG: hypothetical protein MI864_16555, partial [Pseudomonadales bacterium]|nr:hypothetical protein [Pseudomonadales bacterium]
LIQIYSPDLEKAVYDSPKLVQLISKFCRKDRLTQVQILILDENALISSHHRLAELASRLTSKIKLHIVNKTLPYENSAFLLCDEQMLVFRKDIEDGKGYAAFTNRPEVKQLREKFEAMWLRSNASRENRTLGL